VNKFDTYISEYLRANREVTLEKIGTLKILSFSEAEANAPSVDFTFDKKAATSPALIDFIAEKAVKNKNIVAADIESHFAQVREFINIGKNYEIPHLGSIKANKTGAYQFLPYSEINKPSKTSSAQPAQQSSRSNKRSAVQLLSLIIVLAILSGLAWQAYNFFSQRKTNTVAAIPVNTDTVAATPVKNTPHLDTAAVHQTTYSPTDTVNVHYIFETTASGLRARTRTAQLRSFGNDAAFDSFVTHSTMYYDLYLIKPTKLADTSATKDSIAKFLQKDIRIVIEPKHQ
jgi:nucleoid DNA-binding protein